MRGFDKPRITVMHRLLRAAWLLPLLLTLWAAPAAGGSLDEDITALGTQAAAELDTLSHWCTKKRVFGSRDDVYVELLVFDPRHREARKRLRYTQADDGAWVQNPKYKRAKNWNRKAAAEAAERLAAILARYRDGVLARCGKAATIADLLSGRRRIDGLIRAEPANAELPPLLRTLTMRYYELVRAKGIVSEMVAAADELRAHHPQDGAVRALLGEVQHEGIWVLAESARALRDASGITQAAAEAIAAAKPTATKRFKKEAAIDLPWTEGAKTVEIRVVGTQEPETLRAIAERADAAGPLFAHALGCKPSRRAGLTAYVFKEKGQVDTFLAGYPVVDNHTLRERKKIKLDLVYADGESLVLEANPPRAQTDLVVNEVLNQMFSDTFLRSAAPKGWHAEGISRYLAWKLTGTRLSINVSGKYAGQGGDRHVPESGDPWLTMARAHVKKGVDLRLLLGKGVDVFTVSDAMVAYAFAVYLLEGHEGVVTDFVTELAKTADADRACREILGAPRSVVEHRLRVWLDEVTAKQRAAQAKKKAAKKKTKPVKPPPKKGAK